MQHDLAWHKQHQTTPTDRAEAVLSMTSTFARKRDDSAGPKELARLAADTCACPLCRSLAAADHSRDPQGAQAALSMTSTFAKERRVDFLGLPLLQSSQEPDTAEKVLLQLQCHTLSRRWLVSYLHGEVSLKCRCTSRNKMWNGARRVCGLQYR